jgi:hypothetical protein
MSIQLLIVSVLAVLWFGSATIDGGSTPTEESERGSAGQGRRAREADSTAAGASPQSKSFAVPRTRLKRY